MQVKEISKDALKHEYEVVVGADAINQKMEAQLKTIGKRVKIPGFRPGHIPANVLKQRYGKSIMGEVLENTVNQSSQQVLKDKGIRPALPAKIEIKSYEEGGELTFKMAVEVLPKIPEIDFGSMTLSRPDYTLDEKEVDDALTQLASRNRTLEKQSKGTKAKEGSTVTIDFTGKRDGKPFVGGAAKGHNLELGSGQFIPGFEEQLIGVKEGDELTVKVTFPEEYHSPDLAGQPAEFDIVVHAVQEAVVPEADDALAKQLGLKDIKELRKLIRERLEGDYNKIVRARLKKQLFDQMEDSVQFDVPAGMLEMEFNAIWEKLQQAIKEGDPSVKDRPENELREEYRKISKRRVMLGLILSDVAEKENIRIGKEELSRAVVSQAQMFPGQEQKIFEFYQQHPEQLEDLRGPILEDKAVDSILSKVKYKDVKMTTEELVQEDEEEDAAAAKPKKKSAAAPKKAEKKPAAKKKSADKDEEKKAVAKKAPAKKKKTSSN